MSKEGKGAKVGHNKGKPSMVAYVAQNRLAKNKARRAKKEERKQVKQRKKALERSLRPKRQVVSGVA